VQFLTRRQINENRKRNKDSDYNCNCEILEIYKEKRLIWKEKE
jgi:hypothetical protein